MLSLFREPWGIAEGTNSDLKLPFILDVETVFIEKL